LGFARVLAGEEDNTGGIVAVKLLEAGQILLGVTAAMRDRVYIDCKATKSLCDLDFVHLETAYHLLEHHLIEELLKVEQVVGVAVGKGHHVALEIGLVLEVQTIVVQVVIVLPIYA
jgi:hypothetical protein